MSLWGESDRRGARPTRTASIRYHGARLGLALALALATYLLFPASPAVNFAPLEVGAVAPDNVIAPFAYRVPKAPTELARERDDLARTVQPVFVYSQAALDSTRRQADALFTAMDAAARQPGSEPQRIANVQRAAQGTGVALAPPEATYLLAAARRAAMRRALERVTDRWLSAGVAASGALDDVRGTVLLRRGGEERPVPADSVPGFAGLLARARLVHPDPSPTGDAVYTKLLSAVFHPTIAFDKVTTERRRAEMRRTATDFKYEVRKGEKIVGAHEVVGREEYEKMRALRDELGRLSQVGHDAGRIVGAVLFNALLVCLFGVALVLFRPQLYGSFRALTLFAALFFVVTAVAAALAHAEPSYPELIPIALAAILFSVLFDPRISMVAAMLLAVLIGGQAVFRGTNALYFALIGGAAAAFSVRVIRRRNQTVYSILTIAVAYALASLAIGLTLDWTLADIGRGAGLGALNAVVSVALAMVLLPPAEEFTGIDTYLKLLEWSDLNRPLMQRLSLEAPGTYAHTIAMANLAESACNAIGANGLLARVGAYYHDIGKLKKPQFFVENQPKGRNPHDKLKPQTSAQIIRGHIREGIELAEEYKVPRAIQAFITEHHGTGQIAYFLAKANERDGPPGNPNEYQYPGPVPQSIETAVVMLADGVEAATRVLQDPTPQRIRDVVEHIVRRRIEEGQLREAPITLRQLEMVKEQFARVLIGMYHNRIDYPASSGGVTSEFASV